MDLTYGNGGWVRVEDIGLPGTLYVRMAWGKVSELYFDAGDREITAAHLRNLPLGKIAAVANQRPDLLLGMSRTPGGDDISERAEQLVARKRRVAIDTTARLSPPTAGLTDEFLEQVARAYRAAVARGERPNKSLAEQVGDGGGRTVERWVYLARKRGFLPPGRPGRAG